MIFLSVLHPGSFTLRYGLASDYVAQSIPNVIAKRIKVAIIMEYYVIIKELRFNVNADLCGFSKGPSPFPFNRPNRYYDPEEVVKQVRTYNIFIAYVRMELAFGAVA